MDFSEKSKAAWLKFWRIPPERAEEEWAKKIAMHQGQFRAPDAIMDIPNWDAYESPTTGKAIYSKRQREDDLKRSNARPWEGMAQEQQEAKRRKAYEEQRQDARLHETAARTFYQMPEKIRRELSRG